MTEQPGRSHGTVRVDHHMFYLLDEGAASQPPSPPANGLVGSEPGIAIIFTGASSGHVTVTIEARLAAPEGVDLAGWDEVIDHSFHATGGHLRVTVFEGGQPGMPPLTVAGPGVYRIRVHARGRDTAPDAVAFTPIENYLIVAWPEPFSADTAHQTQDAYGAQLRAAAPRSE